MTSSGLTLLHLSTERLGPLKLHFFISERKPKPSVHHGGHQEEDANAETGQGERHRPGRAGGDRQEGSRGQMQAGGNKPALKKEVDGLGWMRMSEFSDADFDYLQNTKNIYNILFIWKTKHIKM